MIYLYSGTPGSGKSYHAVVDIRAKLKRKEKNRVIANFPLALPDKLRDRFVYFDNSEITIDRLMQHARQYHKRGIEGQTLVVIDEAQCVFNSRDWNGKGTVKAALKKNPDTRMDWIKFFSQHRHLGFNFILIAQSDKMIDKQIRVLIEYDTKHLKINNGFFFFLPTSFLAVDKWYGQSMKLKTDVIWYHKRVAKMYDSYALFDTLSDGADGQGEPPLGGGNPSVAPVAQPIKQQTSISNFAAFFGKKTDASGTQASDISIVAGEEGKKEKSMVDTMDDLAEHFGPGVDVTQPDCAAVSD